MSTTTLTTACGGCAASRETKPTKAGAARLPNGWKREPGSELPLCAACWGERYMLRAITLPVRGPADDDPADGWPDLREALAVQWRASTMLANWAMTQLYTADLQQAILPARAAGAAKCPPMPRVYLYPAARELAPQMPSQSVASLLQAVDRKYRARRYEVAWLCSASLPTVRKIADGRAVIGELSLYRRRAGDQSRRSRGTTGRESGKRVQYDVMAKLVAWLPRPERPAGRTGTLVARTGEPGCLITAAIADSDRPWRLHADDIRRRHEEHQRRLQALGDDAKAGERPDPGFGAHRDRLVRKHRNFLTTRLQQIAKELADHGARRRVAEVAWDDRERPWPDFPWTQLADAVALACDNAQIPLRVVTASDTVVRATD